jgi:hypothetical protein
MAGFTFDEELYLELNTDVADAVNAGDFESGWQHYEEYGLKENRPAEFNETQYLEMNPDVEAAVEAGTFATGKDHFIQYGRAEGRAPIFNEDDYLEINPDVAAAVENGDFESGLDHYIKYGRSEERFTEFDEEAYLATYADVKAAVDAGDFESGLDHFLQYGKYDGHNPYPALKSTPGETFELTTGTDIIEGTAGDDTIDGVSSSLSSEKTLNAADQIDGGEGTDTLNVTMKGSFSGFSGDGKLENVENVNLTSDSNIARDFDATGVTGVEKYSIDAAKSAVNLKDLGDLDATIALNDQAKGSFTVAYATDVTKGTSDAQALAFNNVGTVKDSANSVAEAVVTTTIAGVEELTLDVTGDNVADFTAAATKTLTVTGDGSLKIAGSATGLTALKTFDASAATGDLDINLAASTDATTASLGSGDDTLTVGVGNATKNAELSGGDGADTLKLAETGTVQYVMSGFETLNLANAAALTFSATNTSDIETIQANTAMSAAATFASLGSGDYTVDLLGANANAGAAITLDNSGATTLNVSSPASTATAAAPDSNGVDVTLSKSASLNMVIDEKMDYTGTVTASKATSAELDIQGEVTGANISAGEATSVVVKAVENDSSFTLTAGKATDLNVTAAEDLILTTPVATPLAKLEALTVNTDGLFDMKASPLAAISTVTVEGSGSVELQNLGDTTQDGYAITLNATGLSSDETATGSRSLEVGTINTKGQNITVDASGVLGKVTVSTIDASGGGVVNSTAGNVTIDLDGVGDDFSLAAITGTDVTIDAEGALGAASYGVVTLDEGGSLDFTGVNLETNSITATATGTKDVTMTFVGGIDSDVFTVQADGTFKGEATVDATGGIQASGGSDELVLDGSFADLTVDLTMSGIEAITVDDAGGTVTANASGVSGETLVLSGTVIGDVLTLTGTSSAETIDLSGITAGATAGAINLQGSVGEDTITASGVTDVFSYTAENQLGDTIKSFAQGTDAIYLAVNVQSVTATATKASGKVTAAATGAVTGFFDNAWVGKTVTKTASATPATATATATGGTLNLLAGTAKATKVTGTATIKLTASTAATASITSKMVMDNSGAGFANLTALKAAIAQNSVAAVNVTYAAFGLLTGGTLYQFTIKNGADTNITVNEITATNTVVTLNGVTDYAGGDIVLV